VVEEEAMSLKRGEDLYRLWHSKDPKKTATKKVKGLSASHFCAVGHAKEITYASDKWEKDGEVHLYVHDFDSRPKIWLPANEVSEDEVIGRPRKTASLLGGGYSNGALVVALLATVEEFVFIDHEGVDARLPVGRGTHLYSTLDKKTLIITVPGGPLLVRGAAMKVTGRGIVK
jgi:hypothetical protein